MHVLLRSQHAKQIGDLRVFSKQVFISEYIKSFTDYTNINTCIFVIKFSTHLYDCIILSIIL